MRNMKDTVVITACSGVALLDMDGSIGSICRSLCITAGLGQDIGGDIQSASCNNLATTPVDEVVTTGSYDPF